MSVGEHAKKREELWPPLNLIENDEPLEWPECEGLVRQAGEVEGIFQIEVRDVLVLGCDLAGQGRLADLSRPEKRDYWTAAKPVADSGEVRGPGDHIQRLP